MIINIGNHDFSILWDGVYYKALSDYPNISEWEMKCIMDFVLYEKANNRKTDITGDNSKLVKKIKTAIETNQRYPHVKKPRLITECKACHQKGCHTEYVCHTATKENALKIMACGSLLSALKLRRDSASLLVAEKRNPANDPIDFFHYVMFSWGNCQAGDRLVMERTLERMPTEEDLSLGFTPGIRFYFKYDTLATHPGFTQDGYHALKIKDEVVLQDYLEAIIIPDNYRDEVSGLIPSTLRDKVFYLTNDCRDIWHWSAKVYDFIRLK